MSDFNSRSNERGSSASATSRSLIERLKRNDTPAWRELVQLYSPLIYHWCQKSGLPHQDCADVIQDVFRSVVGGIGKFRKEKPSDTFRGWLRTVTRNKVHDHFRRCGKEPYATGGTEAQIRLTQSADVDDILTRDEDDLHAEHALYLRAIQMIREDFSEQTWQAFWRVVVEGGTAQEVGEQLGMRPGTVRVAKSRVLKRLREQLADPLE